MDRVANTAKQAPDLILRQRFRQTLLPGRGEPFFPRTTPGTAERMAVEETQTVLAGLERAARHPALTQVEQVASHLLLAELIR